MFRINAAFQPLTVFIVPKAKQIRQNTYIHITIAKTSISVGRKFLNTKNKTESMIT